MAVIEKIRKRSLLLLIAIGGAMILFILSDLLWKGGGRPELIQLSTKWLSYENLIHKILEQENFFKSIWNNYHL